jgi:hypothetical protein
VWRDDRDDAVDAECASAVVENGGDCFGSESLSPEFWKEGVADIRIVELCSLEEAAHANRFA